MPELLASSGLRTEDFIDELDVEQAEIAEQEHYAFLSSAVRADRRGLQLSLQELTTVCILMFYGTGAYIPILMPNAGGAVTDPTQSGQVHAVNHITLALAWSATAYLVAKSWRSLHFRSKPAIFCLLYSVWGFCSVLWSMDLSTTLSAGLAGVFSTLFSMFIFGRFPRRRIIIIFTWAFMGLAFASAVLALGLPEYGVDHFTHEGAWQGVYAQKNGLGNVMVFGMAFALAFKPYTVLQKFWRVILFFAAAAEVGLSQSREAWLLALLVVLLYPAIKLLARFAVGDRSFIVAVGILSLLMLMGISVGYGPALLEAMGRDVTLTGRTDIWRAVLQEMPGHWFAGYGLGGFWGSPESQTVYQILQWTPSSAHNGYLESLLQLGSVGLGLTMLTILSAYRDCWRSIRNRRLDLSTVPYFVMFALPILNFVAYLIPYPNGIYWSLLIVSSSMLEQDARGHHRATHDPGLVLAA